MNISEKLENTHRIIIYGARLIALEVVLRLQEKYSDKLWGCVVTSMEGNPKTICGYPVCVLSECDMLIGSEWQKESCVILAVRNVFYQEVYSMLSNIGVKNCISFEDLIYDETFLSSWREQLISCHRMVLMGDKSRIQDSKSYLEQVWPELTFVCVDEDEINPEDLVIMSMDGNQYKKWMELAERLYARRCLNITDIQYMYEYTKRPQGWDKMLPTLLWERQRWRIITREVIEQSRTLKAMLEEAPCVDACIYGVRNLSSKMMSVDDVFVECIKECAFWKDGGGITLSGGEPLLWKDFCIEIGKLCYKKSVHFAIETCGYVPWENFEGIIDFVDIFLYDLKIVTPALRHKWLGANTELDIRNLRRLAPLHKHVVVRVPLIPDVNDTENEFMAILSEIRGLEVVTDVQLMPFHQLGSSKYELAGMTYSMMGMTEENDEAIARCRSMAEAAGFNVDIGGKAFTNCREV